MVKVEGTLEKKNANHANKVNKNYGKEELTRTLIMGLVGLVLVLMPDTLNKILGIIVGIVLLLIGLGSIYTYIQSKISFTSSLISGILYTLLGIIILISPGSVVRSIAIGIGIVLSITGLSKVRLSFTLKEINTNWIGTLVIGVITTILGIVLIFNPFSGDAITKFAGAFLVIVSIFDLIDNYILQK